MYFGFNVYSYIVYIECCIEKQYLLLKIGASVKKFCVMYGKELNIEICFVSEREFIGFCDVRIGKKLLFLWRIHSCIVPSENRKHMVTPVVYF